MALLPTNGPSRERLVKMAPEALTKAVQAELDKLRSGPYRSCHKCRTYVSIRAQEALNDAGMVIGYWYQVICEACKETGPETMDLKETLSLWVAKHKLLSSSKRG